MTEGIVNVLKPPGMTSHDVVSYVRKIYQIKRVGHAGTLDPAAAGVLPVFVGPATRLIEYTTDANKSYRVEMTLGYETDTGDDTGRIIRSAECAVPSVDKMADILEKFVGEIDQVPPMYSAIKVGGKKLYELARNGVTIERKARRITIHSINLIKICNNKILFDVCCSKGTYIRTLCTDIGNVLNCPTVMSFLVRSRVGSFSLQDAWTLEEIKENPIKALSALDKAINHLDMIELSSEHAIAIAQGKVITTHSTGQDIVRLYDPHHRLIGIGLRTSSGHIKPVKILPLQNK